MRACARQAFVVTFGGAALAAASLFATPAVGAQNETQLGPVTATVRLTPDEPVIGDAITLEVEAVAEDGVEVLMPEFGEALDRFQIVDFAPRESLLDDGRIRHSQRYTLRAPMSGDHTLPPLLVEFVDRRPGRDPAPEGEDAYELLTEAIAFHVESVTPDAASAPLSPPLGELGPLGAPGFRWWVWALASLALLAVAGPFGLRLFARWLAEARRRGAYEVARSELDALLAGSRPGPDQVDAFFVQLSGIVRRFLEDRFGLDTPGLTSEEFLDRVGGSPDLDAEHQGRLQHFLRQADLVKYAHHLPTDTAIDEALRAADLFLEEFRREEDRRATGAEPLAAGAGG